MAHRSGIGTRTIGQLKVGNYYGWDLFKEDELEGGGEPQARTEKGE